MVLFHMSGMVSY